MLGDVSDQDVRDFKNSIDGIIPAEMNRETVKGQSANKDNEVYIGDRIKSETGEYIGAI